MNKNEKMYDAITNIRDDIIEKAGKYSFEKKKRSFAWIGYAAAVCLLAGAAVFGLSRIAKKPADTHEASLPTEQITAIPTEDSRRVITGENGNTQEFEPKVGERILGTSLEEAIKDPENDGCLFDVKIVFYGLADINEYLDEQETAYNNGKLTWNEYVESITDQIVSVKEKATGDMIASFAQYGYDLEQTDMMEARGLLTREQIESIPVDNCGVMVLWADHESLVGE